jgi:leucyl aminopeptidase
MIGKSQMPLSITSGPKDPLAEAADALVVCVFAQGLAAHPTVIAANKALGGALLEHAKAADFEAKVEQSLEVPALGRLRARRLVLVGAGAEKELTPARLRGVIAHAVRAGSLQNAERIALVAPSDEVTLREVGEGAALGAYRFTKYFTGERKPKSELSRIAVSLPSSPIDAAGKKALALGVEIAAAVAIARDAVNEPPNVVFPETLARIGRDIAKAHGLKVKVLDKAGILKAGMNLHYAVGQGSSNEPRFIHLTYTPSSKKKHKRLVFVGKGLTFDSGGLCIKPAPGMGDMKSDMGGAAAVLGLMSAVAALKVPVEVHGIIGAAENMPDGAAYRPADIFTSLDGKTVEIINTDAEGRLVLADALTYAARLKPDLIVDAATLTGAALVALGKSWSAFYTADAGLAKKFSDAASHAGEGFWQMPLIEELTEQLKSDVADLKHTGDRYGGSITAALFLREFVAKVPWIHCDIAGPVLSERARGAVSKGATGHAVLTFLRFVETFTD